MRCPKCGAHIARESPMCLRCGTKTSQITEASHKAVKEAKANYEHDKIVYSTVFPKDLDYKTTLLICIFFGYLGIHYYYVKRPAIGIFCSISMAIMSAFIIAGGIMTGWDPKAIITFNNQWLDLAYVCACVLGVLAMVIWVSDIVKLATKRFKIPVVLKEKRK